MQDDITDGTQWLINEGIADKDKICIFGASYGGYAANMAVVKTPDLFTCAVSFAGISDLKRLARQKRRFLGRTVADEQIGDKSSILRLVLQSTILRKIKTPVLLIHGAKTAQWKLAVQRFCRRISRCK